MAEIPAEKAKTRSQLAEEAIAAALASQWERVVELNTAIRERFGSEEETNNRLGKAYLELGRFDDALSSYKATLELNPLNAIALKNVNRIEALIVEKGAVKRTTSAVDVNLFVEEMGKTALAAVQLAPGVDSALVTPGEQVELVADGDRLYVKTNAGVRIGAVEDKLARRLSKFIAGGNQYTAAVAASDDKAVRVILRETYQAPQFVGMPSFPVRKTAEFRAYAKDTLLRDVEVEDMLTDDEDSGELGLEAEEELEGMHAVDPANEDAADFGDEDKHQEEY